jgi:hypothetical protein
MPVSLRIVGRQVQCCVQSRTCVIVRRLHILPDGLGIGTVDLVLRKGDDNESIRGERFLESRRIVGRDDGLERRHA